MQELRANTQVKVKIGPVVAVGDGFTPVTTLDLSTADEAELFKHDAAAVTDISGATFAAITSADGYYNLTLTTSHTDTEGLLDIVINDDSLCLPVKKEFMVLSEAAYDSKYVAKDDGFMDVNVKTIGRTDTQETEASNLEAACAAYSATRGLSGTALPAAAADAAGGLIISDAGGLDADAQLVTKINSILDDTGTAGVVVASIANNAITAAAIADGAIDEATFATTAGSFAPLGIIDQGTCQAGSTGTTIVFRAGLSLANDIPNGSWVKISSGTGAGQSRFLDDFVGATDTGTVSPAWTTTPDNTSVYQLCACPPQSTTNINAIADQVWEEAITDHSGTAGSTAEALNAAGSAGDPWTTSLPGSYTGSQAGKMLSDILTDTNELQGDWANGGRLDLIIDATATAAELAKVPKSDSNVTWNATALASIQSEANDALVANHLDHLYSASASVNDASATTTSFNTTLTQADTFWDDAQITFTSGALAGQSKLINAYVNANGNITLDEPLSSAPANGVTFVIKAVHAHSKSQITSDVWNNGTRTLTAGTNIQLPANGLANVTAWTVNITGSLSGSVGSVTGAVGSVTGLTASDVAAIKAKTDQLVFTISNTLNVNVRYVNSVQIDGAGTTLDPWGPA